MTKIRFGNKYKETPTPTLVRVIVDSWNSIAGSIIASINIADFIPEKTGNVITWALGASIPIMVLFKPYFGLKTDKKRVPIEQVKELDDHEKSIS